MQRVSGSVHSILTGFYGYEIRCLKLVSCDRVCTIFRDIFFDEPLFVDVTRRGCNDGFRRDFAADSTEKHLEITQTVGT